MNRTTRNLLALVFLLACYSHAEPNNPNTDWFKDAKYGVFMHFLPGDDRQLSQVKAFDVEFLAKQLEEAGARYFVITLGQNSGYFISPNATYSRFTGYAPGERCSTRDLPLDLFSALHPRGIRLMLYLPCQVPNQDARAQRAFGLREGPADQPLSSEFALKWAEVIQEWADRYGDKVAGWWFDGGYQHIHFNEAIAQVYEKAVKHGNSKAIVTYNPGVRVIHYTDAEDYTAGELNEPLGVVPDSRWLAGSQWHALTYVGPSWGQRDTRYSTRQWADWVKAVVAHDGVVTLDMGPNWDPAKGPIGSLAPEQLAQVQGMKAAVRGSSSTGNPKRLKRADSFLGIHFDFHAGPDNPEIGRNTTPEMIEAIIDAAHPDYIQIDCKGHPGISSYPTKVGNPAPHFAGDPLRVWREATARRGVALYMHYSGVWDSEAIRQHPDWAAINADGKTNANATSFFGPYADRLLIPQLRELGTDYGVDGVWVDGDCWAAVADYSPAARKAFTAATGFQEFPRQAGDPHWFEFLQFHREAYRGYLRHFVTEIKRTNPDLQLCSNWSFSDHMPEEVCAPVDWISGDLTPEDAVNSARFSSRYLARQGKPWDLMPWSFTIHGQRRNGSNQKAAEQLEREAAEVLAQGGGFESYYGQRRDGSVPTNYLPVLGEVARFCRARQPFCQGGTPVPQIALLYSTASHYREINGLFNRDLTRLSGTLQALLESQQIVDVVGEHVLAKQMAEYPLIVVGECDYLDPAFKQQLVSYVGNGGSLLLIGPDAAALFASELGVVLEPGADEPRFLAWGGRLIPTSGPIRTAKLESKARPFGQMQTSGQPITNNARLATQPAASITALGKGRIAATYFSFSRGYLNQRSPPMRAFLDDLTHQLFPRPMAEIKGPADVDVSVNRVRGKLEVHLINTSGPHWDTEKPLIDSIVPVGPLEIAIRPAVKPARMTLEPEGQSLAFDYRDGVARLTVPRLDIYSIIVVE
jgi:hypothetical protein